MWPLFVIVGTLALYALGRKSESATVGSMGQLTPSTPILPAAAVCTKRDKLIVRTLIRRLRRGMKVSPAVIDDAIMRARRCNLHETARALAAYKPKPRPKPKPKPISRPPKPTLLSSPMAEATNEQWTEFCNVMRYQRTDELSPTGQLGAFGENARRLEQLGLMTDVRQIEVEGDTMYMGQFVPPLSFEKFLTRPKLQYKVFVRNMVDYRDKIMTNPKWRACLGKLVPGSVDTLTLSGFLGLAKQAGLKGAYRWLTRPDERVKFPHTTAMFEETNGIF